MYPHHCLGTSKSGFLSETFELNHQLGGDLECNDPPTFIWDQHRQLCSIILVNWMTLIPVISSVFFQGMVVGPMLDLKAVRIKDVFEMR